MPDLSHLTPVHGLVALGRSALARFGQFRDTAYERILDVNRTTEHAVLAIGGHLQAIVADAREHVARVGAIREQSAGAADGSFSKTIGRQNRSIASYMERLHSLIDEQSRLSDRGVDLSKEIVRAGEKIMILSRASRLLALNAQIEAQRFGQAGGAFGVIAAEMRSHSEQVAETNSIIAQLADNLTATMPAVAVCAHSIASLSGEFEKDMSRSLGEVDKSFARLQTTIDSALETGDRTILSILEHSNAALSDMQFQDPVAQALLDLDRQAFEVTGELAATLDVARPAGERAPAISPIGQDVQIHHEHSGEFQAF